MDPTLIAAEKYLDDFSRGYQQLKYKDRIQVVDLALQLISDSKQRSEQEQFVDQTFDFHKYGYFTNYLDELTLTAPQIENCDPIADDIDSINGN